MESKILSALSQCPHRSSKQAGLQFKVKGQWLSYSWADVYESVDLVSKAIDSLKTDQNIVIWAKTSRFWFLSDLAILSLGKVTVPIYPNSTQADVQQILNEVQPQLVFVDDSSQIDQLSKIFHKIKFVCFKSSTARSGVLTFDDLLDLGRNSRSSDLEARLKKVKAHDTATIVFTSGTTGAPRGVILTHAQINSEIEDLAKAITISEQDCFLTFLPYAHIVGRTESFLALYTGACLAFAEDVEHLRSDLKIVQPTILVAVPRVIEKIGLSLETKTKLDLFRFRIFDRASALSSVFLKELKNNSAQTYDLLFLGELHFLKQQPSILTDSEYSCLKAMDLQKPLERSL